MQVSLMISTLLAGFIILISLHAVHSLSVSRRSEPQLFTLPLKRIPQPDDIHPLILLQKRIIHGTLRLAKMTGDHSLQQRLKRRILTLDVPSGIDRRFNRPGVHNVGDVQLEKSLNQVDVLKPRRMGTRQSIVSAGAPTAPNSLGLDILNHDDGYLATLKIGKPLRDFKILVDSGSDYPSLWVRKESCVEFSGGKLTGKGCGKHTYLGPSSSSSFANSEEEFTALYGTGEVRGNIIKDTVVIANLTLSTHTFGVATVVSTEFTATCVYDGLMGVAQSKDLSQDQVINLVEALLIAKLVSAAIVSINVGRLADGHNDGEITFGGVDPAKFDSKTLVCLPNISERGLWEVILDGISVDSGDLNLTGRTIIVETRNPLMVLSNHDAHLIHRHIPGAKPNPDVEGGFTLPCNTNTNIAFTFGGKVFSIDPRDLVGDSFYYENGTVGRDCVSCISGGYETKDGTVWLLGDAFLKNVIISNDYGKNTISLAKPADA